jgi:hypothetical protein
LSIVGWLGARLGIAAQQREIVVTRNAALRI